MKISGGGRCNVTNGCTSIATLAKAYPRGEKQLKKAFARFSTKETMEWFESRGVELVIQPDDCVFPTSQNSQTIIDCFLSEVKKRGIEIRIESPIVELNTLSDETIQLTLRNDEKFVADKVIVTTGGSPKKAGLDWLEKLGHTIETPVPSLFTFNMPHEAIRELMGVVVEKTITKIQGTKLRSDGPLLITHWGMSGPSILKLSAFGARILSENNYKFKVQVNWVNEQNFNAVETELIKIIFDHGQKLVHNIRPYYLPDRLWRFLVEKAGISADRKWDDLGKKGLNKITNLLTNDL